jgi:class 3 adenylate cyclase/YHS domain-containing protein
MAEERVHTFLFADLAGFTALTEAHGDEEAADLASAFFDHVRDLLGDHGAEEVKTIGDAIMVRCAEASQAVQLGLRIVEGIRDGPQFPVVRVGMDTGPATERKGDWFGNTVNLAARVSGAAGGDEVLITQATREALPDPPQVELVGRGEQRFKNVREPVRLYRALPRDREVEDRPIDPVCQMSLDPGHVAGTLTYEGAIYQFCSLECIRAFSDAPSSYVS